MATSFLPTFPTNIFLVLVVATAMYAAKATNLGNSNAMTIPVAGIAGKAWTYTQFGTIYVVDNNITETPDPTSPIVGQLQGLYVITALDGLDSYVTTSIMFTNKQYNRSTIQLQGTCFIKQPVGEVVVVGGTGKFQFARGNATAETYSLDVTTQYAVIQCNVTVQLS